MYQVAGHMIDEAYSPSLNQSDPVWGGTTQYEKDYQTMFGYPSSNNDAGLAVAITVMVMGLNNTQVDFSNRMQVFAAMAAVNTRYVHVRQGRIVCV